MTTDLQFSSNTNKGLKFETEFAKYRDLIIGQECHTAAVKQLERNYQFRERLKFMDLPLRKQIFSKEFFESIYKIG